MKRSNTNRRHSGGGPRPDLAKFKREEAAARKADYEKLSTKEKIALLDLRKAVAKKQRAKLELLLLAGKEEAVKEVVSEIVEEKTEETKKLKAKERRKLERGSKEEEEAESITPR
jgi:hypothetical protein